MLGTFVCLEDGAIIANYLGVQRKYEVDDKCSVTLNGKEAKVTDFMPGDKLEVSGQPATSIKATREKK